MWAVAPLVAVLPLMLDATEAAGCSSVADSQQITYYRVHAPNYDIAYLDNDWDQSIEELPITGDVLELACGAGHWTPLPAARARSVTALDAAPEALALARRRVQGLPCSSPSG